MRIVWKDSAKPKEYEPIQYRGIYLFGTPEGWEINIKGNENLYKSHYCAKNAIDEYYGDFGEHGTEKRKRYGVQIIGQKESKKRSVNV